MPSESQGCKVRRGSHSRQGVIGVGEGKGFSGDAGEERRQGFIGVGEELALRCIDGVRQLPCQQQLRLVGRHCGAGGKASCCRIKRARCCKCLGRVAPSASSREGSTQEHPEPFVRRGHCGHRAAVTIKISMRRESRALPRVGWGRSLCLPSEKQHVKWMRWSTNHDVGLRLRRSFVKIGFGSLCLCLRKKQHAKWTLMFCVIDVLPTPMYLSMIAHMALHL